MFFSFAALAVSLLPLASAVVGPGTPFACENKQVLSTSYIGKVKVESLSCSNALSAAPPPAAAPQPADNGTDVCGAQCATNCFYPSGGGPNPYDCQVIADSLNYSNSTDGQQFNLTGNGSAIAMTYSTCETFIVDQAQTNLTYCRDDWASLTNYLAFNCQSTQNAHGGNCVANDGRWFVQVQNSTQTPSSSSAPASTSTASGTPTITVTETATSSSS